MPIVQRQVTVPYSPKQMFDLVNNIDDYPEFVTACVGSRKEVISETELVASLEFARAGIHKSFTTRNRLEAPHKIDMELVDGPFKHLEGFWYFDPLEKGGCEVRLELEFEFAHRWLSMAFGPVFNQVANKLVDVFYQRAHAVYGETAGDEHDSSH